MHFVSKTRKAHILYTFRDTLCVVTQHVIYNIVLRRYLDSPQLIRIYILT